MYIHIAPRMFAGRFSGEVELIDLVCVELGLHLQGSSDLTVRRPYPNKSYHVACRKVGQKAVLGILIETDKPVTEFNVVTRWGLKVDDGTAVTTHRAHYQLINSEPDLDSGSDLFSEDMDIWSRKAREHFRSNHPQTLSQMPTMSVFADNSRCCDVTFAQGAVVLERSESVYLSSASYQDLQGHYTGRMPALESAFPVQVAPVKEWENFPMFLDLDLGKRCPSIAEVMDRLLISLYSFPDGSCQLAADSSSPTGMPITMYSPRLSEDGLEWFCNEYMPKYLDFYETHHSRLERMETVPMEPFWTGARQ